MGAPVVQSLEDVIKQIQTAYQPQQQQLDSLVSQNETAGTGQIQGLDAAKTQAFGQISQAATNKGMTFSGFTPNEQATYTGSTYLPALAKLQDTITSTRNSLFGKKADLVTQGNLQATDVQRGQQSALQAYNDELAKQAAAAAAAERERQFTASENEKNRALSLATSRYANGGGGGLTQAQAIKAQQDERKYVTDNYKQIAKPNGAGFAYTGPGGQAISAYDFAQATGQDFGAVLSQDTTKYAQGARTILAAAASGNWGLLNQANFVGNGLKSPPASARNNPNALASWLKSNYSALF